MPGVFITYRRRDGGSRGLRVVDGLIEAFGHDAVYSDVEALRADGDDTAAIDAALARASVCVVVVGPQWLEARDARGASRLAQAEDLVRRESAAILASGKPAWILRVGGAARLGAESLPPGLARLSELPEFVVSDSHWWRDLERATDLLAVDGGLIRRRPSTPPPAPSSFHWLAALALFLIFLLLLLGPWGGPAGAGNDPVQTIASGDPAPERADQSRR